MTLEYLHGISAEDAAKLRQRGLRSTRHLMHAVTLEVDRARLERKTGISADRLLAFGRECAMIEISSMGQHLDAVRRLGLSGLKQLKRADAEELHTRLVEMEGVDAPSLELVQYWISQARYQDCLEEEGELTASVSPS